MIIAFIAVIIIAVTAYVKFVNRDTNNRIAKVQKERNNA